MNSMIGVNDFIKFWDLKKQFRKPFNENLFEKTLCNSININGESLKDSSIILTKNEKGFYASIENGVRELVTILVDKLFWMTYSSCEGHSSYQGVSYKKRIVQILPRNNAEKNEICSTLRMVADYTNEEIIKNPIIIKILDEFLESDSNLYSTVKIIFDGNNCSEEDYFYTIEQVYKIFIVNLERYVLSR